MLKLCELNNYYVIFIIFKDSMSLLQASLAFTGANSGPCLGVFLLGVFYKNANAKVGTNIVITL